MFRDFSEIKPRQYCETEIPKHQNRNPETPGAGLFALAHGLVDHGDGDYEQQRVGDNRGFQSLHHSLLALRCCHGYDQAFIVLKPRLVVSVSRS